MPRTVTILPETSGTTLCLELHGEVTAQDYQTSFQQQLIAMVDKAGYFNLLLIYAEDFTGWTPEAADLSFKNLTAYGPKVRKAGYVNAPDSRMLMMKMLQPLLTGEVRFFDASQKDEAFRWVIS